MYFRIISFKMNCFSFGKMKTSSLLLQVLYVTSILNLASTSDDNAQEDVATVGVNICQLLITTNINHRYAITTVTQTVTNTASTAEQFTFSTLFPNNAFLTGFIIEKNGTNYTSYIEESKQATKQRQSITAASLELQRSDNGDNVRDSQKFSVSFNLEAESETTFYLTYEELLQRKHGLYEHVINVNPGQLVTNLGVLTYLNEVSKITDLVVAKLRSGNEMDNENEELDPQAFISQHHKSGIVTSAKVLWIPSETEQKTFAQRLKTDENDGFAGQFIIRYNVGSHQDFGEIITSNGYFVNFFTPKGLHPLTKHVVFVLDTSGSMKGKRIQQLKQAMKNMLPQLKANDLFSLVEFDTHIKVQNLDSPKKSVSYTARAKTNLNKVTFPKPYQASPDNIKKGIQSVEAFKAKLDTDILSSLKVGLRLIELGRNIDKVERQAIIMFLTDGKPTVGEKSFSRITEEVTKLNQGLKRATISTLSFGLDTDRKYLKSLALQNMGMYQHIYEASDSDLQIEAFFETISTPVLSNVNFKYDSSSRVTDVPRTEFPVCYEGSELVVVGQYTGTQFKPPVVEALGADGALKNPLLPVYNSSIDISRLWAFVTAKELINQMNVTANSTEDAFKKVLNVCLKYSFVSPYSSLVIVKPNEENSMLGTDELDVGPFNSDPKESIAKAELQIPKVGHRMSSFRNLNTAIGKILNNSTFRHKAAKRHFNVPGAVVGKPRRSVAEPRRPPPLRM